MLKVSVVGQDFNISNLFNRKPGFDFIRSHPKADILVFTGGADIEPKLYGETPLKETHFSPARDKEDLASWEEFRHSGKLMVGICRGAQFLNVMNGGKLWQHVNNHRSGTHMMIDTLGGDTIEVTSTHHQMMIPSKDAEILGIAFESTEWENQKERWRIASTNNRHDQVPQYDTEIVWYKDSKSLCFQPHPEFGGAPDCTNLFFDLVENLA